MDIEKKSFIEEYLKKEFPESSIAFHEKPEPDDSAFIVNPINGKEAVLVIGGQWSMHANIAEVKKVFSINNIPDALKTCGKLNVLVGVNGIELGKFI